MGVCSSVQNFVVGLAIANFPSIQHTETNAPALARRGVVEHDIGNLHGGLLLHDAAAHRTRRIGTNVLLHDVNVLHEYATVGEHAQHIAAAALVLAGDDDDLIALFDP